MSAVLSPRPAWPVARTAWSIFALVAGILLLTTGGHTYASDEEIMLSATYGVVTRGDFTLSDAPDAEEGQYGPGQAVAAAPLLWAGLGVAGMLPPDAHHWVVRAAVSWLNPLVTAGVAALLVVAVAQLGFSRATAIATALIYALATPAWPHSKSFFAEPLTALLLFASLVVAAGPGRRGPIGLVLSGALAGLAPAVKIHGGLFLPLLGLWVLWLALAPAPASAAVSLVSRLRARGGAAVINGLAWGFGVLLGLSMLGLYQWAAFGNPLLTGYGAGAGGVFRNELLNGLYGLLLSPGKSVLLYAPPLLLWPFGVVLLWRRDRALALLCASLAVVNVLFYARLVFWHGDGAWGPRYLNIVLPFLVLPLAAVIEAARQAPALRLALIGSVLLAVPVQLGGVSISLNAYLGAQPRDQQRYYVADQSPILGHLRLLADQLGTRYALHLAPGRLALVDGFSYSEGDRAAGEALPRWSRPEARFEQRVVGGAPVIVTLALAGCRPAPLSSGEVLLRLDGAPIAAERPCPGRVYRLVLPPERAVLTVGTAGWRPLEVGIGRDETLGVFVAKVTARQGERLLPVVSDLIPAPPMPAGHVRLRQWNSDYRYGHFDFWWWFLGYTPLTAGQRAVVGGLWLGVSAGLIVVGLVALSRAGKHL